MRNLKYTPTLLLLEKVAGVLEFLSFFLSCTEFVRLRCMNGEVLSRCYVLGGEIFCSQCTLSACRNSYFHYRGNVHAEKGEGSAVLRGACARVGVNTKEEGTTGNPYIQLLWPMCVCGAHCRRCFKTENFFFSFSGVN